MPSVSINNLWTRPLSQGKILYPSRLGRIHLSSLNAENAVDIVIVPKTGSIPYICLVNMTALSCPPGQRRLTSTYATTVSQWSTETGFLRSPAECSGSSTPTSPTATRLSRCCVGHDRCFPSSSASLLMSITGFEEGAHHHRYENIEVGNRKPMPSASRSCQSIALRNAPSRGPTVAVITQRTSSTTQKLSSQSSPCHNPHHAQATRGKCLVMNPHSPDRHQ